MSDTEIKKLKKKEYNRKYQDKLKEKKEIKEEIKELKPALKQVIKPIIKPIINKFDSCSDSEREIKQKVKPRYISEKIESEDIEELTYDDFQKMVDMEVNKRMKNKVNTDEKPNFFFQKVTDILKNKAPEILMSLALPIGLRLVQKFLTDSIHQPLTQAQIMQSHGSTQPTKNLKQQTEQPINLDMSSFGFGLPQQP